jgi:hypothetical protein
MNSAAMGVVAFRDIACANGYMYPEVTKVYYLLIADDHAN